MKYLHVFTILSILTLYSASVTLPTHTVDTSVASIEVVSQDETQEIAFEATLISYDTDAFKAFGGVKLTTPYTLPIRSSDFVGVFKKIEGGANMRVTLTIGNSEQKDTLKCGAESCIVVRKNDKGHLSGL